MNLLDLMLRILALCVLLACAETLHGIARTVLVAPRLGKARALKLSALTGIFAASLGVQPEVRANRPVRPVVATSVARGQLACEVQQGQPHQPLPTAILSGE